MATKSKFIKNQNFKWIRYFDEIELNDVASVGGKNASLGEMTKQLSPLGIRIPAGFAITAQAYLYFLHQNKIQISIDKIIEELDVNKISELSKAGQQIREMILSAQLPPDLKNEILSAYQSLNHEKSVLANVAVRSSATVEDLPEASFAGQQETFLNISGPIELLKACRMCFASLYTDRAIAYRHNLKIPQEKIALSVGVQNMVRSDLASSGVIFTLDTESGFKDAILINSSFGLGENVVKGLVNPDEFIVFKPTLRKGFYPIIKRQCGSKELRLVYDSKDEQKTKNIAVPLSDRNQLSISDDEVIELARWSLEIEDHYSRKNGYWTPMDIEWAKDGANGLLFILQARPETVHTKRKKNLLASFELKGKPQDIVAQGLSVGSRISTGRARIIRNIQDIDLLQKGEILVTEKTDPDWEPVLKRANGVVTNRGGRTCHAAIVSREIGLPAVVGCGSATETITDGDIITVSCAQGETGFVYRGQVPFKVTHVDLDRLPKPPVSIMMNIANPGEAMRLSMLPNSGVGLVRQEFIISNHIGIHPMALVRLDQLKDQEAKEEIQRHISPFSNARRFFIDQMAQGIGMITAAFYPKDVIVRLSDFKSNEYAGLIGGREFEPYEENPMLGLRGASRYYHPTYREAFALECLALLKVRAEMGLKNLKIMVPFCRSPEEGQKVLSEMKSNGLVRGEDSLEVYMMCEIPSNVILAREFSELFDGFSIGSNDLTQLILGVDRDSAILAPLFDERDPAVKAMISQMIQAAKKCNKKIGFCGQAPSDFPEFARWLTGLGIDSISLNPDAVLKTIQILTSQAMGPTIARESIVEAHYDQNSPATK